MAQVNCQQLHILKTRKVANVAQVGNIGVKGGTAKLGLSKICNTFDFLKKSSIIIVSLEL